jgi:hypothetical protein
MFDTNKAQENLYSLMNKEMERLHDMIRDKRQTESNVQAVYLRLVTFQDAIMKMGEAYAGNVPKDIKDLQVTVAEMLLTGANDASKSK